MDVKKPTDFQRLEKFVNSLFVNGAGTEATRLVLVVDHPNAPYLDVGGWSRQAIMDRVAEFVSQEVRDAFTRGQRDAASRCAEIARERLLQLEDSSDPLNAIVRADEVDNLRILITAAFPSTIKPKKEKPRND